MRICQDELAVQILQRRHDAVGVLSFHDAQNYREMDIWIQLVHRLHKTRHRIAVVSGIQNHKWFMPNLFATRTKLRDPQFRHVRRQAQLVDGGQRRREILPQIRRPSRLRERRHHVVIDGPADGASDFLRAFQNRLLRGWEALAGQDKRHAFLQDARLLPGDFLYRVAQQRHVVETDRHDDRQDGLDVVRRIQPAADSRLEHDVFHACVREDLQRHHGEQFEQ